jgi:hypothetical protein
MRIGILGSGDVARALGTGFATLNHEVMLGSREAANPKTAETVKGIGHGTRAGSFADAARFGELVVLATHGVATGNAIAGAGPASFAGKIVIDATNPLEFIDGKPRLVGGLGDSAGERNQKLLPGTRVVKAFNTVGNSLMFRPELPGGPPDMFICGNDAGAKKSVTGFLTDFGWHTVDLGDIGTAHYMEAMCLVWVLSAASAGNWNQAFKLLRK